MIERLNSVVRDYSWGDLGTIASIQGRPSPGTPEAELWIGAHPSAPSVLASSGESLTTVINSDPATVLGPRAARAFGQLPFLTKVLAAAEPLSIQTHPSLDQARAGFDREEAAGIDRAARERTYRDANHKPELICALTPFEAKCGLRGLAATRRLFDCLDDSRLDPLRARLDGAGQSDADTLADTLAWLLRLPEGELQPLIGAVAESTDPTGEFAADLAWVEPMMALYGPDPGILVGLLLNHVVLEPGDAIFLKAGNIHCYLRGAGVEVMATSDNVIRCGLTPKFIDREELLNTASFEPLDPPIQRSRGPVHRFDSPVSEFALTRITEAAGLEIATRGPEILLVTAGKFTFEQPGERAAESLVSGDVLFVSAAEASYSLDGSGTLWRSTIGNIAGRA